MQVRGEAGDRACGIEDIVLLPEEEEKHEPESVPEVKENVGGEKADPEEEEEEKIGAAMEDAGVKEDAEEEEERVRQKEMAEKERLDKARALIRPAPSSGRP